MEHTVLKFAQGIFLVLAIMMSLWEMLVSKKGSDLRPVAVGSITNHERGSRRRKLYGAICLWISAICWFLQLVIE